VGSTRRRATEERERERERERQGRMPAGLSPSLPASRPPAATEARGRRTQAATEAVTNTRAHDAHTNSHVGALERGGLGATGLGPLSLSLSLRLCRSRPSRESGVGRSRSRAEQSRAEQSRAEQSRASGGVPGPHSFLGRRGECTGLSCSRVRPPPPQSSPRPTEPRRSALPRTHARTHARTRARPPLLPQPTSTATATSTLRSRSRSTYGTACASQAAWRRSSAPFNVFISSRARGFRV
jgi:hypothetical protein